MICGVVLDRDSESKRKKQEENKRWDKAVAFPEKKSACARIKMKLA